MTALEATASTSAVIHSCCLLAPDLLGMTLAIESADQEAVDVRVLADHAATTHELTARWLQCPSDRPGQWLLLTIALPAGTSARDLGGLRVRIGGVTRATTPDSLDRVLSEPRDFGLAHRDAFDPAVRRRMQAFLAGTADQDGVELTPALASTLNQVRDTLRGALPKTKLAPGPCAARLESVTAIDDRGFWLSGWVHDAAPRRVGLTAISPEGESRELALGVVMFHPRPKYALTLRDDDQVSTLGYHAYVELEHPSRHREGWVMEFRTAGGRSFEDVLRGKTTLDASHIRETVSRQLGTESPSQATMVQQLLPALTRLQGDRHDARVRTVSDHGNVAAAPGTSIVVAVSDIDGIARQLTSFAGDPSVHRAELLFVCPTTPDDPPLSERAEALHDLHGVPFRVVALSRPARRARSLNLGASIARGSLLVLLNSDVAASGPGWLGVLREFYYSSPSIGVVGPKLVFADDSIAQAGLTYRRRAGSERWERTVPFAGLPKTASGASSARQVQAVSDDCLMIEAERFRACGGLTELYLDGGDEAGDLCLRMAQSGGEAWYLPEVELRRLDSDDSAAGPGADFNEWLFSRRWHRRLAATGAAGADGRRTPPPPISSIGSGRPGPPTEILDTLPAEPDGTVLADAALSAAASAGAPGPYASTYSFVLRGWAVPRSGDSVSVEVRTRGRLLHRSLADLPRDAAEAGSADQPDVSRSGFQFVLSSLGLPTRFDLDIEAVAGDGSRASLGRIRGRRRAVRSAYVPVLAPVLITMMGRTGSTWLQSLVSQHREVVAYEPYAYEPMLVSYWMRVLQTLTDPASYMEGLLPEIYDDDWWMGRRRQSPLPLEKPGEMARWLGRDSVEIIAGFCQSRLDGFYKEFARLNDKPAARYFVEKCPPGPGWRLAGELYPQGREIFLVRDFRDRACSVLEFTARRGLDLWGRKPDRTDAEWFEFLRDEALGFLGWWRQRRAHAHLVRYEDLITEPDRTLATVFSYLGVDAGSGAVRQAIDAATAWNPQAQKEHATSTSAEASIGRWRQDLSPERQAACAEAFDDVLSEFGYEPTTAT